MATDKNKGNYEIQRDYAKKYFLAYDQQEIVDKLDLESDEKYIYLWFVGKEYRVDKKNGRVEGSKNHFLSAEEAGFQEVLSIFDLLCYSEERPKASGIWAPINSVKYTPRAIGVNTNFNGSYPEVFDKNPDGFRKACEKLGGTVVAIGDIGYEIPIFDEIRVRLKFYFSDDEFPAQMVMLWDSEILKYMRYETTFYVMGHVYQRIMEEQPIDS